MRMPVSYAFPSRDVTLRARRQLDDSDTESESGCELVLCGPLKGDISLNATNKLTPSPRTFSRTYTSVCSTSFRAQTFFVVKICHRIYRLDSKEEGAMTSFASLD